VATGGYPDSLPYRQWPTISESEIARWGPNRVSVKPILTRFQFDFISVGVTYMDCSRDLYSSHLHACKELGIDALSWFACTAAPGTGNQCSTQICDPVAGRYRSLLG
jgi:hypothetical protein